MSLYTVDVIIKNPTFTNALLSVEVQMGGIPGPPGASTFTTAKGITAYAGGLQANATQLTAKYNRVDTVATTNDSVKAPAAVPNDECTVINNASNDMHLYPKSGENFYGLGANVPIVIVGGQKIKLICYDAETGVWTVD